MKASNTRLPLKFIPYQSKYDPFIIRVTMNAMQQIFVDSTGIPLTEEMLMQQVRASDTTLIICHKKLIGYYCCSKPYNQQIYFGSLILTAAARGKGYGPRILNHVENEALRKGAVILLGHVQTSNRRALSFWLKHGFEIVGPPQAGSIPIQKRLTAAR